MSRPSVSVIDVSIIGVGHRNSLFVAFDGEETENLLVSMAENEEREEKYARSALDY